jgi:phenylacetic acid degradation operon negative regulatory protein
MNDVILSTIKTAQTSLLVYSTLSAYGGRRTGELPGTWFVAAFAPLGREVQAVRQSLFRMVREKELVARKEGRVKLFRLSPYGLASTATGFEKLASLRNDAWDGEWTIVRYEFTSRDRFDRDRLRDMLETEGFAAIGRGVFVHPHDRTPRIHEALRAAGQQDNVMLFRARRVGGEADAALVRRLWDLDLLAKRYRKFIDDFAPLLRRTQRSWKPEQAFAARLAIALAFLEVAWDDPEHPASLLPARWPGERARELAFTLYQRLLPGTLEHGDSVLASVSTPRFSEVRS